MQVNDKMCVRQRKVWFMLYSSSGKEKTKGKKAPPHFPWHFLIILRRPFLPIHLFAKRNSLQGNANSGRGLDRPSSEKRPTSLLESYCSDVQSVHTDILLFFFKNCMLTF